MSKQFTTTKRDCSGLLMCFSQFFPNDGCGNCMQFVLKPVRILTVQKQPHLLLPGMFMLLFSFFPVTTGRTAHWDCCPKHTACWPSVSRTLLLPSNQSVAFYKYTFFLQINIIYAKKCIHTCIFLPERLFRKRIFLALLVTSRDVSASS